MNVEGGGFQPADLWQIARRRGKIVAGVTLVSTLAAYWIAMALPNEYQSYATVLVEPQAVDPGIVRPGVASSDLADRLHLMTAQILSRGRLSRIIDELELYQNESEYMVREQVIDLMRSKVMVEPVIPELVQGQGKGADYDINTFKIKFYDGHAKTARAVAQRLANDFIESHIEARVNVSQKSVDFIEGELERLSSRIAEVEAQVAKIKADNPGRLPEDTDGVQRQMERTLSDLAYSQRRLAEAQSDEAFFRSQLTAAGMLERPSNDTASPTRRIDILELALAEFEAKGYTEKHPDVVKAKLEIAEIKQQLAKGEAAEAENEAPQSFAEQNAQAELRRATLRIQAAQEEIDRLQARADELQQLLIETPAVAEQLEALEREYRHLFESYQDFSNRRLEAMVQAQLERRQLGEQFRVLEPAFAAPKPSSPDRPMIVVLGFVLGLALGTGLALLLESFDSSVHTARQLQTSLNLPVLASIPQIWLESDRAALRRRRIRTALGTVALVVFVLIGGAGSYLWVNGSPSVPGPQEPASPAAPAGPAAAQASPAGGEG